MLYMSVDLYYTYIEKENKSINSLLAVKSGNIKKTIFRWYTELGISVDAS